LPRKEAVAIAHGLHAGMAPLAERFGVTLAGGDTNAWDGPFVVCVTVLGEATPPGPVMRSGARPGDLILVTGPLGGSLMGRHLRAWPRVAEAQALQQAVALLAMIDISDGLAAELGHILEEGGGLGATLEAGAIPIHEDAVGLAGRDGRGPLEHALHDGEDFELCFTIAPEDLDNLRRRGGLGCVPVVVGRIEAEPGLRVRGGEGRVEPLSPRGFDHLATEPP